MKRSGFWLVSGLLLMLGALAFVSIELVQRRRFGASAERIDQEVSSFRSKALLALNPDGSLGLATRSSPDSISMDVRKSETSDWTFRRCQWQLTATFKDSRGTTRESIVTVYVHQKREGWLRRPEIRYGMTADLDQSLQRLVHESFGSLENDTRDADDPYRRKD